MVGFVAELDEAAVGFDNLARQGEADTGTGFLGGVEGHEEVLGIGEAVSIVFNKDRNQVAIFGGSDGDLGGARQCCRLLPLWSRSCSSCTVANGARFRCFIDTRERRFDGVAQQIDEELLDLVGVGEKIDVGRGNEAHVETDFKRDDAFEQRNEWHAFENGRGQLRKLAIGLNESVERFGAILNDGKATLEIPLKHYNRG